MWKMLAIQLQVTFRRLYLFCQSWKKWLFEGSLFYGFEDGHARYQSRDKEIENKEWAVMDFMKS